MPFQIPYSFKGKELITRYFACISRVWKEKRTKAINSLSGLGRQLLDELGGENMGFIDPLLPPEASAASSRTISKDPRNCPTIFFHSGRYFDLVCLIARQPTVVMPIMHNYMTLESAIGQFGDTEVPNAEGKTVSRNNFGVTFLCVVECLIDAVMESVRTSRKTLEEAMVNGQGRAPTLKEYRNVPVPHIHEMGMYVCMFMVTRTRWLSSEYLSTVCGI